MINVQFILSNKSQLKTKLVRLSTLLFTSKTANRGQVGLHAAKAAEKEARLDTETAP